MRLINADILLEKVREEARNDLHWKEANRMIDLILATPVITDVIPAPKKKKKEESEE